MIGGLQGENGVLDIKNLKQNIQKCRSQLSGSFRRNFAGAQDGCEISQPKADFAALQNWPSAWSDLLPMALTPSFQLRIAHRLKHWIFDFLSFESTYRMHKLDFRKCSKSGWHDCHQECFMADFSLLPLLAFWILLMAKDIKALVLHVSELSIALPWIPKNSPQSRIALVIKLLTKRPKLTQFD